MIRTGIIKTWVQKVKSVYQIHVHGCTPACKYVGFWAHELCENVHSSVSSLRCVTSMGHG